MYASNDLFNFALTANKQGPLTTMDITGKIIRVFPPQSGTSKAGNEWKKQEYLLEVENGNYAPRQVFFNFFGARVDENKLEAGKDYRISFDIESREYNGRWYTDIRAYRAEAVGTASNTGGNNHSNNDFPVDDPFSQAPTANDFTDAPTDDLPF